MILDEKKLRRQQGQVQTWIEQGCSGTIEAVTGYGKTMVIVLAIQRLHRKYPNVKVDVVVPKIPLYEDWTDPIRGHLKVHKLNNVEVFVVNTYCRFGRRNIGLLCVDEIHNYASEEFIKTFEVAGCVKKIERTKQDVYILGATATIQRLDGKDKLLEEYAPVFDTVTMEEAKREGYISSYKIYNLGLELNKEDRKEYNKWHDIFNNSFGKFNHNFELAMACSRAKAASSKVTVEGEVVWKNSQQWCHWWSQQMEWDGELDSMWSPSNISKYAQQFMTSMRNRKTFIYRASVKLDTVVSITKKFQVKTMIFSEDTIFADAVTERLGEKCASYHTKVEGSTERVELIDKKGLISYKVKKVSKKEVLRRILESFKSKVGLLWVSSIRALKEGFDFAGVVLIIMASYNSSKREDTQTMGRGTRKDYSNLSKNAIIVNLYIKESQEEKWLKEKQRGKSGIIWVNSIDEINPELEIFDIELT